ncbi:MAG: EamA family transporter [Rhodobacteraceae bacterium]|nr:MAG: EamA family transporter [Paracoccaceae bacterium]
MPASNNTARAALWMTGAIASFSSMAVAGRELGGNLDTFEIMMYRSFVGLVIVCILLSVTRQWSTVTTARMGTHLIRNMAHFTGQNLWFFAVTVIPLAQVFALEFTSPLWVVVLAPLLLGERLTPVRALSALLGFVGILIVTRPSPDAINAGVITAASSAIFFAITMMLTKQLTRTQSIANILFWLTLMQAFMGLATAGIDGEISVPDAQALPWVVLIGLAGLTAHYCLTNALAIAPATIVAPLDFARLPVIAVVGMVLYQEALDVWVLIGALVIFGGNYLNILSQTRRKRVAKP